MFLNIYGKYSKECFKSAALKGEIQEINYKILIDIRIYDFSNLPCHYEFVMADQPPDATPVRESLRRSSRPVKRYGNIDPESDGTADSDPEFHLSDSDDDPDFNPVDKKVSKGGGVLSRKSYNSCFSLFSQSFSNLF